jgi:hypothetical protein
MFGGCFYDLGILFCAKIISKGIAHILKEFKIGGITMIDSLTAETIETIVREDPRICSVFLYRNASGFVLKAQLTNSSTILFQISGDRYSEIEAPDNPCELGHRMWNGKSRDRDRILNYDRVIRVAADILRMERRRNATCTDRSVIHPRIVLLRCGEEFVMMMNPQFGPAIWSYDTRAVYGRGYRILPDRIVKIRHVSPGHGFVWGTSIFDGYDGDIWYAITRFVYMVICESWGVEFDDLVEMFKEPQIGSASKIRQSTASFPLELSDAAGYGIVKACNADNVDFFALQKGNLYGNLWRFSVREMWDLIDAFNAANYSQLKPREYVD